MIDFGNILYLKTGNATQQLVHRLLSEHDILIFLREFDPILVGTIPIGIDLDNSDLDIICYFEDQTHFYQKVCQHFRNARDFKIEYRTSHEAVVAGFWIEGFEIEIFGQNIPTRQQNGYRHMMVEHRLLSKFGENFRLEIVKLKMQGFKTEPAFAKVLGLKGNPYEELLNFEPDEIV